MEATLRSIRLRSGVEMPLVGLGTWPMVGEEATAAVMHALSAGYRLIDTSEEYGNEDAVGAAVRRSDLPREQIFITTKFNVRWHGVELVQEAWTEASARLGVDYIDLMLIHWPNPWVDRYVDAWRGLLELREQGRVRAIGVASFLQAHIDRLLTETGVAPEVNQVELDPTYPQRALRDYHAAHGIATEAWSPLGRAGAMLTDPIVLRIAERHAKSAAQVILRWHTQQGIAVAARSSNPERIAQNIDIFDFELAPDELAAMAELDRGRPPRRDPETHGH